MKYDALYGRQSIEKRDSISVESQLEYCRYETHGEPYIEYTDKGFSGKNTHRPGFEKMMEDIVAGKVKRVIVYKLDRISRSILDFANMMEVFQQYQVEFVSSTEKFDTSTPIGRAMLNICIVFAQLERETIQKRVTDAYYARNKRGFYMGGRVPYGYRLKETVIDNIHTSMYEEVPEESEQLKVIFSMYADSTCSLGDIVRYLKEQGMIKLRGSSWNTSRISEILRNPVYVKADMDVYHFFQSQGTKIQNPFSDFTGSNACYLYKGTVSADSKQWDLSEKELVLAPHQGFIPSKTWLACRTRCLNNRQSAKTGKAKNSWLAGKVKCKNCGYALTIRKAKTKWGRYFVCSHSGQDCQGTGCTIYADILEKYMANAIQTKLAQFSKLSPEFNEDLLDANIAKQKTRKELRLKQVTEEIHQLLSKLTQANDTLIKYINEKVEALDGQKRLLEEELLSVWNKEIRKRPVEITDHVEKWKILTFEDRQTVVDLLIQVIHIGEGKMEIVWRNW